MLIGSEKYTEAHLFWRQINYRATFYQQNISDTFRTEAFSLAADKLPRYVYQQNISDTFRTEAFSGYLREVILLYCGSYSLAPCWGRVPLSVFKSF
jgi:hypothetical protein